MSSLLGSMFNLAKVVTPVERPHGPLSYMGQRPTSDLSAQLDAFSGVGTLFACVHRIESATGKTEWKLYRKKSDKRRVLGPSTDTRVEILPGQHPALDLWNQPNPFMTRQRFVSTFMNYLLLAGDATWYCSVNETSGTMLGGELWPLRPDRVTMAGDPLLGAVSGLVYRNGNGEQIPLELEEFIQIQYGTNPKNALRGLAPVAAILTDLGADQAAAAYNAIFFHNNASPNGVIEVPGSLSDEAFTRLQMQWREQHQGVHNSHRAGILEGGMTWKDTSYSMKDMLFPEMRELTSKLALMAFGMSKTMIGQTEDVNRATAEIAKAVFYEQVVDEMNDKIKEALNTQFLPMFGPLGEGVEFDYVSDAPEDAETANAERTSKVNAFVQLINAGVDPEEAAEVCGLPPMTMREVQDANRAEEAVGAAG